MCWVLVILRHFQVSRFTYSSKANELYHAALAQATPPQSALVKVKLRLCTSKTYKQFYMTVSNGKIQVRNTFWSLERMNTFSYV